MDQNILEKMAKDNPFLPLNNAVYEIILQKIISFQFHPGSKINESQISEELGVSRSPVRDALSRLEKKNYVIKTPGKGYFVSDFSKKEYKNITDLSFMLEPYAAGEAAVRLTDMDIAKLYGMADCLETLFRNPNYKDLLDAELNFHMFLIGKSNNPFVQSIYEDMKCKIFRYRSYLMYNPTPDLFSIMTNDHRVICDALQLRDKAIGEATMRRHLSISHRTYIESGFFDKRRKA
ncbi:MAG: GntR family transcriptional regulator [Clostridia bacterium]|nr:GntR family transcriptional regulator [Clostridia bacterium]